MRIELTITGDWNEQQMSVGLYLVNFKTDCQSLVLSHIRFQICLHNDWVQFRLIYKKDFFFFKV